MIRDSVDVYIDGQRKVHKGSIAEQGGEIRITGEGIAPIRFQGAKLFRATDGTVAYTVPDPQTGKTINIAAISQKDCGCGKT